MDIYDQLIQTTFTRVGDMAEVAMNVGASFNYSLGAVGASLVVGAVLTNDTSQATWIKSLLGKVLHSGQPLDDEEDAPEPELEAPVDPPSDPTELVRQMIQQDRYALLILPQISATLPQEQLLGAIEAFESKMALVPEGEVLLGQPQFDNSEDAPNSDWQGHVTHVDPVFLDRHLVTNRQYYQFVADGGYQEMGLWDPEVLAAVLDFVDRTGALGPRYWKEGRPDEELLDHPVVGICWYEAAAYARWTGKRLPSDSEWVKAGSWPVPVANSLPVQRKYPWGDSMDYSKANIWGTGFDQTIPVTDQPDCVSPGGIYQMVGNVWEWTSSQFGAWHHPNAKPTTDGPMYSLRGGAFDTFFDNHACCQFQSGEGPLSRRRNIGFRCALSACVLAPTAS